MGLNHSQVFGNVLCKSGSFWYKPIKADKKNQDEGEREKRELELGCWMSKQIKLSPKLPLKFYITVGVLEGKKAMIENALDVKSTLESLGYPVDFEFFKSGHDYLSWGEMFGKGLISLVGYKNDKE